MAESFQLRNDPPKWRRKTFESNGGKQTVLFSGLDCLPTQKDLFATDGQNEKADEQPTQSETTND